MQSFPVFIFYSVKREREKGEGEEVVKCLQNVCLGSPTFNASLYPTGWLLFYDDY